MSFQSDYKISVADRADKGVTGLPDTPGLTTTAMQERFDSLANLSIDKFNNLVDAVEETLTDEAKLVTGAAVKAYTDDKVASAINDTTASNDTTYSSNKIDSQISARINDSSASASTTYSSNKIDEKFSAVPEQIINDSTAGANTTYSSDKIEQKIAGVPGTIINDSSSSASTTYSSQKIDALIADVPAQSVIDDAVTTTNRTYSSTKIEQKLANVPITPIDDTTASSSSVYSSNKVNSLISGIPSPSSVIDDSESGDSTTYSSNKILQAIASSSGHDVIFGTVDPPSNVGNDNDIYVKVPISDFGDSYRFYTIAASGSDARIAVQTIVDGVVTFEETLAYNNSPYRQYPNFTVDYAYGSWRVNITTDYVEQYPNGREISWQYFAGHDETINITGCVASGSYIKSNGVWITLTQTT